MDKEILNILARDARTTPAQLSVMTGRPEAEVAAEVKEMEDSGIIRRYKTIIDWERAGVERVFAFIDVRVTPSRGLGFDEIARRIYGFPEVHSVYLVSGDYDLRVVAEGKTMQEVALFVAEKLATLEHVLSTRSNFLLRKYKDDGDVYDEAQTDDRLAVTP